MAETMKDYEKELEASYKEFDEKYLKRGLDDEEDGEAWTVLAGYLEEKTNLTVKVKEVVKAGVVVEVEGIRGFIPASQLSMNYVEDLDSFAGKKLTARVIEADREKEKLVLSAKEILKEKEQEEHQHKVAMVIPGSILEGTVESLQTYGAFVSLQDGLSGLVHISQISEKRIRKPSEVLKIGDRVRVKVLNTNDGKISLSIKAAVEQTESEELEMLDRSQFSSGESVGTSLGDLFAKLNL